MKITRDYVFDMIELVGKAITTGRLKPASPEDWLFEVRMELALEREDPWGAFEGKSWKDSLNDNDELRKKARREQQQYGDSLACQLWKLQRRLSFKELPAREALTELQAICAHVPKNFISQAWANQLARIVDLASH